MSTARLTGSGGGGGGGEDSGASKDAVVAAAGGVLKVTSGAAGGSVDRPLPKLDNHRGCHEAGRNGAIVCRVSGTSVAPATGSISAHPFSGSCGGAAGAICTSHSAGSGNRGSLRRLPLGGGGMYVPAAMAVSKAALRRRRMWMVRATRAPKITRRREIVAMKVYR